MKTTISKITMLTMVSTLLFYPSIAQKNAIKVTYLNHPLIKNIYTADPSAHIFQGRIYIYPSHDIDAGVPENDNGDHFAMRDYHIFRLTG